MNLERKDKSSSAPSSNSSFGSSITSLSSVFSEHKNTGEITKTILFKNDNIDEYLEEKLNLCSNLKNHFDSILCLKDILKFYMSCYEHTADKRQLKIDIKKQLIAAGIFDDEKVLEFLLLISERIRPIEQQFDHVSGEKLGEYYFDIYKDQEKRSVIDFDFYLNHNHSYQQKRSAIIEEVILDMIAQSRANMLKVIENPNSKIIQLIQDTDTYFQNSFQNFFGTLPPLSLIQVTNITREYDEYADRISGKTFINQENYLNKDKFVHLVIHEGMHLCFDGFKNKIIEDGLIEYFIEKMFRALPSESFIYTPVSTVYQDYKNNIKSLFLALPEVEDCFKSFFISHDKHSLISFLKKHINEGSIQFIEDHHYSRNITSFIRALSIELDEKIPNQ